MAKRSLQIVLEQYLVDFPFIRQWTNRFSPENVRVKVERVDLDVLSSMPTRQNAGDYGEIIDVPEKQFFLVRKDGRVLGATQDRQGGPIRFRLWQMSTWGGRKLLPDITVQEAMVELGTRLIDLSYVVCVHDIVDGLGFREDLRVITIYKCLKSSTTQGFSLYDFLEGEERRIRDRVKQEVGE